MEIENLNTQERLSMLHGIYVAHPDAEDILKKIERCHNSREYSAKPRSMSLTGVTGSGKTTLIEQYMFRHPPSETEKNTSIPIFKSVIQPNTSVQDFVISVLKSLVARVSDISEDDVPDEILQGRLSPLRKRLYKYIAEANVKIIILDEFQHLISSQTSQVFNAIADTIKTMIIEAKVPVILVGTTKANAVFAANPEMARRISDRIDLKPFTISNEANLMVFRKFLAEVDKLLPFKDVSKLATKEMSYRFFAASNGYIDDVMRIVVDAGYNAIMDGSDNINIDHLSEAFELNPGQNQKAEGNPFSTNFSKLQAWRCIEDALLGRQPMASKNRRGSGDDISDIF